MLPTCKDTFLAEDGEYKREKPDVGRTYVSGFVGVTAGRIGLVSGDEMRQ